MHKPQQNSNTEACVVNAQLVSLDTRATTTTTTATATTASTAHLNSTIVGELVTTSELYTCSTNDCGGRGIILADQSEIEELDLHGDTKTAHALIVVLSSSSSMEQLLNSVSNMCPPPKVVVTIARESMEKLKQMMHRTADVVGWRQHIEVGDRVDALFWPTGLWLRATVVDMDHRYVPSRRFMKLTYHGVSEAFDIWTSRDSSSIAPVGSHAMFAKHGFNRKMADAYLLNWRSSMVRGTLIDAKDTMGNWYKSSIIDIKGDEIKVHYQGWKPRWDIWMNRNANDVAPVCTKTRPWRSFKKEDVVDANPRSRDDHTAWTEGVVVAVDYSDRVGRSSGEVGEVGEPGELGSSGSEGVLRALESSLGSLNSVDIEGLSTLSTLSTLSGTLPNTKDPFHINSSSSPADRVLVRFPLLHTEQWFNRDSEELCVPGK